MTGSSMRLMGAVSHSALPRAIISLGVATPIDALLAGYRIRVGETDADRLVTLFPIPLTRDPRLAAPGSQ
jgi:hypothetical protein